MSSPQPVIERGTWQYLMNGGTPTHRRKKGAEEWEAVEVAPTAENAYRVCVVRENQGDDEPKHWSLFIYQEGVRGGMIMQVSGDVLFMHHLHDPDFDIFGSPSFKDQFDLGTVMGMQRAQIWAAAHEIAPPRAASQAQVIENCQGWTIRLVQWLVQQGMVEPRWIESLSGMTEPV